MTRSGLRPARRWATPTAPAPWSRCCCCTDTCHTPTVVAGITAALAVGSISPDVVAVEARKASTTTSSSSSDTVSGEHVVISLPERRDTSPAGSPTESAEVLGLLGDDRPLPTVGHYDQLLELGHSAGKPVPRQA